MNFSVGWFLSKYAGLVIIHDWNFEMNSSSIYPIKVSANARPFYPISKVHKVSWGELKFLKIWVFPTQRYFDNFFREMS